MIRKLLQTIPQYQTQTTLQNQTIFNFSHIIKKGYLLPEPPKRAPSAYNLYVMERQKIQNYQGTGRFQKLSEDYQNPNLDVDLKKKFERQSKELTEARQVQMERYKDEFNLKQRSPNAYNLLYMDILKKNPELKVVEVAKLASKEYKSISASQLKAYQKKSEQLKEQNKKRLEAFNQKYLIPFVQKRQAKTIFKMQNPNLSTAQADKKWNSLSDEQKQKYRDLVQKDIEKQQENFQKFLKSHKLTTKQFEKLYNKHLKKEAKKSEQQQQQQ